MSNQETELLFLDFWGVERHLTKPFGVSVNKEREGLLIEDRASPMDKSLTPRYFARHEAPNISFNEYRELLAKPRDNGIVDLIPVQLKNKKEAAKPTQG
ncbi:MAG: hypothetical protein PHY92_07920 [Alphaproteobacteria bacterium]|nr:hypothetical protein [Alphaproteobacteria bacterium]